MIDGIAPIFGIAPIHAVPQIAAIPRVASSARNSLAAGFRTSDLPPSVKQAFDRGPAFWREAMREAKKEGIEDPARLADLVFFMQHPERMSLLGEGKLIDEGEVLFYRLRAEWDLNFIIAASLVKPSSAPDVFLKERTGRAYGDFVAPRTTGKVSLMIHGRKSDGTGRVPDRRTGDWIGGFSDTVETFARIEETIEALVPGDSLYIASWQFLPRRALLPSDPSRTWGDLLWEKAEQGVKIRAIISQHIAGSTWTTPLPELDEIITALTVPDNFQYIFTMPAFTAVHHQKFVVALAEKSTVAFCGGLDLGPRGPLGWTVKFVWHDVAAKLEGKITSDLERQFVEQWNHEKGRSLVPPLPGWSPFETLKRRGPTAQDKAGALNQQPVQMVRTVSEGPLSSDIRRDDIWRAYFRLIGRASRFIYLENQYFQQPDLADAIVKRVQSQPGMIVMVVAGTGTDDPDNFIRDNMFALRLDFFTRLSRLPSTHLRVYTLNYADGLTHTKLLLVDDEALSVGSANANGRGFFLDTELNFVLDHAETVRSFRERLWAHNLGVDPGRVAGWNIGEFFPRWDKVAKENQRFLTTPERMMGEGVIPFSPTDSKDPRFRRGNRTPMLPDVFF